MGLDRAEPDLRVPDALVSLAAAWTLPVLQEVATSAAIGAELRGKLTSAVAMMLLHIRVPGRQ
jgi:hypothetical protein